MGTREDDLRQERAGKNQSLFREVNERIEDIAESFHGGEQNFVCECASPECTQRVRMTISEYEELRRDPTHFGVAKGHELPDVETVVATMGGYVVVAKRDAAGKVAIELDPRDRKTA